MLLSRLWVLVAIVSGMLLAAAWPYRGMPAQIVAGAKSKGPLAAAQSWHYQLDKVNIDQLASIPADLMVIDYAKAQGKVPLTSSEVARIKAGPNGSGRYVVAYLSIGEAEEFRFYWKDEWKNEPPEWLGEENCAWPQAHRVRYWTEGWKEIVFAGRDAYLRKIIEAGFDGIYLDRIDIFETYEKSRPAARAEMIEFVRGLAHTAWRLRPGFFVIAQNAEVLLDDPAYRATIDGLGKESLLHGISATAERNATEDIAWSNRLLRQLQRDGKPVFVVEYLLEAGHMERTARELRQRGMIPTFQTRALDGQDPSAPVVLNTEIGTPERTQKECPPGTSW